MVKKVRPARPKLFWRAERTPKHGKWARTPLAAFFNIPSMIMDIYPCFLQPSMKLAPQQSHHGKRDQKLQAQFQSIRQGKSLNFSDSRKSRSCCLLTRPCPECNHWLHAAGCVFEHSTELPPASGWAGRTPGHQPHDLYPVSMRHSSYSRASPTQIPMASMVAAGKPIEPISHSERVEVPPAHRLLHDPTG